MKLEKELQGGLTTYFGRQKLGLCHGIRDDPGIITFCYRTLDNQLHQFQLIDSPDQDKFRGYFYTDETDIYVNRYKLVLGAKLDLLSVGFPESEEQVSKRNFMLDEIKKTETTKNTTVDGNMVLQDSTTCVVSFIPTRGEYRWGFEKLKLDITEEEYAQLMHFPVVLFFRAQFELKKMS